MALERRFPDGFLWGTAASAHQVEGGNRWNDWWRFEQQPGAIADGTVSGDACRHWERYDDDFALAAGDGHTAHRFSLEWSRIEPEPGRIDAAAVAHYHAVLASLLRRRLTPIVTLHHFTLPLWLADRGGWESRDTIDRFAEFVRFAAREFGGEVDWWCTINEPEVYAFRAYSEGIWPPGRRDDGAALAVMANLLEAHGRAYRILHETDTRDADADGRAAIVGFAKHWVPLEPLRTWSPLDRLRAAIEHRVFNHAVAAAAVTGTIDLSIPGARAVRRHVPELEKSLDYFGLNHYTRWKVDAIGRVPHVAPRGARLTDLGWEVHPTGFEQALVEAGAFGAPVLVTENGFADASDAFRPAALVAYAAAITRAIDRGVRVLGYLHWSLMDNFEWADGFRPRFGLYAVDFGSADRPRTPRPSAALFARIARANALTPEIAAAAGEAL
ncbi:MAG: glycoside hydrolase family 1 protein [Candidatus Eisenbacteria bacterium]|uniref:Glycoside hydrolase family 1 protein n=1 Tax=Eiseniibacteriota bacterium TaxID=2212470 RepID=A0A9D6L4R9_UNCEI|nr:glycoside hydrolase family 1 protein [Candidatus Eisenbacteria bacterium]MBI3538766.1 glycoside hydrolase family 1 protein [Candidatus Eisenbacteria bacterium]